MILRHLKGGKKCKEEVQDGLKVNKNKCKLMKLINNLKNLLKFHINSMIYI